MVADIFGLVGQTIDGRYRLRSVVGSGGFGAVYRGERGASGEPVAVKVLRLEARSTEEYRLVRDRLRAEADLQGSLSPHAPDIARLLGHGLHDLGPSQSVPYLVLEWLDGHPLGEAMDAWRRQGLMPRSEDDAIALLAPAMRSLEAAHRGDAGAVLAHRDLRPESLFVQRGGRLKVLDLGVAGLMAPGDGVPALASQSHSGLLAFSPLYGAPEQFHPRQFGHGGPATDVHALALILVELVSGRRALAGDDYPSCFAAGTAPGRPTPRACGASVSEAFERTCARALALDPRERYRDAGALLDALLQREAPVAPAARRVRVGPGAPAAPAPAPPPAPASGRPLLAASLAAPADRREQPAATVPAPPAPTPSPIEVRWAGLDGDPAPAPAASPAAAAAPAPVVAAPAPPVLEPGPPLAAGSSPAVPDPRPVVVESASARFADALPYDQAVAQYEARIELAPDQVDSYRGLHCLYTERGETDRAWCVAAALVALQAATGEEREAHERYRPPMPLPFKGRIPDEGWKKYLYSEEVCGSLAEVFAALGPAVLAAEIARRRARGGEPVSGARYLQDPRTTTVTFAKLFGWCAHVLGFSPSPLVCTRTDVRAGMSSVVGESLVAEAGQKALYSPLPGVAFLCAQQLTRMRDEFLLAELSGSEDALSVALLCALGLARGDQAPGARVAAAVDELRASVRPFLSKGQTWRLREAARALEGEGIKEGSLRLWRQGVERTAARAGLLLCGDPGVARACLLAEERRDGDLAPAAKVRQMLAYAVSTPYLDARRSLGVAIG